MPTPRSWCSTFRGPRCSPTRVRQLLVRRDQLQLARLLTQRGVPLVATLEPANGLDRGAESTALVALGRSITEPAVQRVYREYVAAFDSIVRPDYLVLAVETNLIRAASKPSVYATRSSR